MSKFLFGLVGILVIVVGGGIVFLGTYKLPAPAQQMEVEVPNDRLSLQ